MTGPWDDLVDWQPPRRWRAQWLVVAGCLAFWVGLGVLVVLAMKEVRG